MSDTPDSGAPDSGAPAGEVSIPALLRAARRSYGDAIRAELHDAGFIDMPVNGPFVLGAVVNNGASVHDALRGLRARTSTASALLDTLVARGYLSREADPADPAALVLAATPRGVAAAAAVRAGVEAVDAELAELVTAEQLAGLRAGLRALATIRERREAPE